MLSSRNTVRTPIRASEASAPPQKPTETRRNYHESRERRRPPSQGTWALHLLAQFAAQDFARGGAGNGLHEADFARLLVAGKALGNKVAEFGRGLAAGNVAFSQHHEGAGQFAGGGIALPDHAAIAHRGMLQKHSLDLGRRHGKTLVLDHL